MPNEPDRYDLDEMLDRLKQRSSGESSDEGELVTRADGSQAVKVRRRKRRSRQPHKERQKRIRMLQVSAVLVLILVLILLAGFATIYVNTAPFRRQVVEKLAVSTGAEAKLQQFRMNPTGANAQGVDLDWPEGNVLGSLSLGALRADVSPFALLGGTFSLNALRAHTGNLVLRLPDHSKPRRVKPAAAEGGSLHFSQFNVHNLQIHIEGGGAPSFRLSGSEATYKPAHGDQRALLRMTRGDLLAPQWPMLRLDRAYIEFDADLAKVVGLSFRHADDDRGVLELAGELRPYDPQNASVLALSAESFLMSGLLGDSLGSLIQGRVDSDPEIGESSLVLSFDEHPDILLSMAFRATADERFVLENIPFLFALSQILGDEWFSQPNFGDKARGILVRNGQRIELSRLEMMSENRMAVRGALQQESGMLKGRLEVGIAPGMIQASENRAVDAMFGKLRNGYRWVELEISGTPAAPEDDFAQLYDQALKRLKVQPKVEAPDPQGSDFEQLTRPR